MNAWQPGGTLAEVEDAQCPWAEGAAQRYYGRDYDTDEPSDADRTCPGCGVSIVFYPGGRGRSSPHYDILLCSDCHAEAAEHGICARCWAPAGGQNVHLEQWKHRREYKVRQ